VPFEQRGLGVIKCYFIVNRGKWLSAKEISEFIQGNRDLRLGKFGNSLSPHKISLLLRKNYFRDLETKKSSNGTKLYCYTGGVNQWQ
jgi:hypothetical protein